MSSPSPFPRVAILDDYQSVALTSADWSHLQDRISIDVYSDTINEEDLLVERLLPYTIVCAMRERTRFSPSLLDRLPNLKYIATTGYKNAAIDIKYAREKGILVSGTGSSGNSTMEHIWALILSVVRYISLEDSNVKAGAAQWQSVVPFGLSGRTLGLVGVGNLGSHTAKIAKVFNMRVIGWSPNLTRERAEAAGVEFVASKEELLERSDIVSIHMVLSERSRHLLKAADLAHLKSTAFFINTSRGPIVEEEGLVDILQQGKIAGAGLDVFDVEPLPLDHPFRNLRNVTLTPHNGYVNDSNYETFWSETVDNITSFLDGKPKRVLT